METEADSLIKDGFLGNPDLVPEQEFPISEMLKIELKEDFYDQCAVQSKVINMKNGHQNRYSLNSNVLEYNNEAQVDQNIIRPYQTMSQDVYQHYATYHTFSKDKPDNPKPLLLCSLCGYRTFHTGHMRVHVTRHKTFKAPTQAKIFQCDKCAYETKNKTNLKLHSRRHEKEERMYNEMSDVDKSIKNIKTSCHIFGKKKPKEIQLLQCPDCDYKTVKTGHFRFHVLRHKARKVEARVLICEICAYQTTRKSNLYIHMRRHKEKIEGKSPDPKFDHQDHFLFQENYKCERCDFCATNKRQLYRHNATHKTPKERRAIKYDLIKCNFCNYQSNDNHLFNNHLKSHSFVVTEDDTFKCSKCDFKTIRNITLKVHMAREHNSNEVTMNKCEHCSYESLHRNDFKKHLLTHKSPDEVKMWKCLECNHETLHKSNLNTHIIRRHRKDNELEIFKCYNCTYESRFKSRLKEHMVIHRRPNVQEMNKCPDCDYQTMRRKNFLRHLRLRHSDKKEKKN